MLADSVGAALLVVLDTLAPAERLAFVLHDLFAMPFDEIGTVLGRSPAAARQLASRARRRVQGAGADEPDPPAVESGGLAADDGGGADDATPEPAGRRREVVTAFLTASRGGDFAALLELLDPEAVVLADAAAVSRGPKPRCAAPPPSPRRSGPRQGRPPRPPRRRARPDLDAPRRGAHGVRVHRARRARRGHRTDRRPRTHRRDGSRTAGMTVLDLTVAAPDGACPVSLHTPRRRRPVARGDHVPGRGRRATHLPRDGRPAWRRSGTPRCCPTSTTGAGDWAPFDVDTVFADPDERTRLMSLARSLTPTM